MKLPDFLNLTHWRLRNKFIFVFTVVVVLPMLLIMGPFMQSRRVSEVRGEHEARLATLGPVTTQQVTDTLDALRTNIVAIVQGLDSYTEIEEYARRSATEPERVSEDARPTLHREVSLLFGEYTSLSRIRFVDANLTTLLDATSNAGVMHFQYETSEEDRTLADGLLETIGAEIEPYLTNVYAGVNDSPTIDVIVPLRPAWDASATQPPSGYAIFSQDLLLAIDDPSLPDLLSQLETLPESDMPFSLFLANSQPEGAIFNVTRDVPLFTSAASSRGYLRALAGQSGVGTYYSPLLGTEVLAYYGQSALPDGPLVISLAETKLSTIEQRAAEDSLLLLVILLGGVTVLGTIAVTGLNVLIVRPIERLTTYADESVAGRAASQPPGVERRDEVGQLNKAISLLSDQLQEAITDLEVRMAQRTRNLETILEIGRITTNIRELDPLLEEVVDLIRDRFDRIYHAQVFLIDPHSGRANLRASTGAPGRQLLQHGHFLAVGSQSVIGRVTASGHAVVALDTSTNPIHRRNEFLSETRAEMALPLRLGERIIGALDLQSMLPDAFDDQDVELFQGMADQITVAIENATLFVESTTRMEEIEKLNRALTQAGWRELSQERERPVSGALAGVLSRESDDWSELQQDAVRNNRVTERIDGETVTFAVPVRLREEVIGAIEWQIPRDQYNVETRQTAQQLSMRLALAAENIRLFEQSRRAAQRELRVNQITSQLTGTTDVDQILQTAVRELGQALRIPQTAIRLNLAADEATSE